MITAKEAKALYDDSGAEVENYITGTVEPYIRREATAGKRTVFVLVDAYENWRNVTVTPLQQRVVDKLKELGFTARFTKDGESYVPRGLADDDGNGPKHTNYGYLIGW